MKNLWKCQEMMAIQQKLYQIICFIEIIISFLAQIYQDFNTDFANNNNFKSFKYQAKLLGSTEAGGNNRILRNATIDVSLKHLSNFWRSFKMQLMNCKIELKLKWKKHNVSHLMSKKWSEAINTSQKRI